MAAALDILLARLLVAAVLIVVLIVVVRLPLPAEAEARLDGRRWRVCVAWHLPGGRRVLWSRAWEGSLDPIGLAATARRLRARRGFALSTALARWAPLLALLRFGRVERLSLDVRLGAGDAALTGQAAALAWAAAGGATAWFAARFGPLRAAPRLRVEPVFDRTVLRVRAVCIVASAPRDIIIAFLWAAAALLWSAAARSLNLAARFVKSVRRGGVARWKGIPSKV